MKHLIDRLAEAKDLPDEDLLALITLDDPEVESYLAQKAVSVRERVYGRDVYIRGLIEFTNYCKNDCYYCGIRRSNTCAQRYRLTQEEILECCREGWDLGFRTFVLQGGEDPYYTKERITDLVRAIKAQHPECAVTLSVGEWDRAAYAEWKAAGADRYLSATKRPMQVFIAICTPKCRHWKTVCAAWMTSKIWAIRWAAALWSVLPGRRPK